MSALIALLLDPERVVHPLLSGTNLLKEPFFVSPFALITDIGTLDANGSATAQLEVPADPLLAGMTLHHAYLVKRKRGGNVSVFASNAVQLDLTP